MKSLYRLRNAKEQYQEVGVRHDLTQIQREDLKELIKEAKEKSDDTFLYRVTSRGPVWDPYLHKRRRALLQGNKTATKGQQPQENKTPMNQTTQGQENKEQQEGQKEPILRQGSQAQL